MWWRQLAEAFGGFDLSISKFCDPRSHSAPFHFQENQASGGHGCLNTDILHSIMLKAVQLTDEITHLYISLYASLFLLKPMDV